MSRLNSLSGPSFRPEKSQSSAAEAPRAKALEGGKESLRSKVQGGGKEEGRFHRDSFERGPARHADRGVCA